MFAIPLRHAQKLLRHFCNVATHYRDSARWLGDDDIAQQFDAELAELRVIEAQIEKMLNETLTRSVQRIESLVGEIEGKLVTSSRAALLKSKAANGMHSTADDIRDEAILYRQAAGLSDDPDFSRMLERRSEKLASTARELLEFCRPAGADQASPGPMVPLANARWRARAAMRRANAAQAAGPRPSAVPASLDKSGDR
jgi:hypothetical protein